MKSKKKIQEKLSGLGLQRQFILFSFFILALIFIVQLLYYIRITTTSNKMAESYADGIALQAAGIIANIMEEARQVAYHFSYGSLIEDFLSPNSEYDLYRMWSYQSDQVRATVEANPHIYDIAFYRTDGHIRFQYDHLNMENRKILDKYTDEIMHQKTRAGFFCFSGSDFDGKTRRIPVYIQPVQHTSMPSKFGQVIGVCVVMLKPDLLKRMISNIPSVGNANFYLADSKGLVVSSTHDLLEDMEILIPGKNVIVRKIAASGWSLICSIDDNSDVKSYHSFGGFFLITAALIFFLIIILIRLFNQRIVSPIFKLHDEINSVISSRFTERINMSYNNEIGGIAHAINIMLDHHTKIMEQILKTQHDLYEKELEAKHSELSALENQVNPHFINNTLNCICGIAAVHNTPMVVDIISNLAGIFNYSFRTKEEVTLKDEVGCLRQYLSIIDIRFDYKFSWRIDIPDYLMDQKIAKMILQPLVENAVYHGLEKKGRGSLSIHAVKKAGVVCVKIEDNGVGIETDQLTRIQNILNDKTLIHRESIVHRRIGIANTCWRIKMMFGDEYGIKISSVRDKGTRVELLIPHCANKQKKRQVPKIVKPDRASTLR
jgi:sensor histidine kinase YesM